MAPAAREVGEDDLLGELSLLPPGRQLVCIRNMRRFQTVEFGERCVTLSWSTRFSDPRTMLWAARTAVVVADLSRSPWLQISARIALANALRVMGRHRAAHAAVDAAGKLLHGSGRDESDLEWKKLECQRLVVQSGLSHASGESARARREMRRALLLAESANCDFPFIAALLVSLSIKIGEDDPEEGLRTVTKAVRLVAPSDLRLRLIAHHNAAEFLLLMGRSAEAARVIEDLTPLYNAIEEISIQARRWHLTGKIALALGFRAKAKAAYRDALEDYAASQLGQAWAMAALELASIVASEDREESVMLIRGVLSWLEDQAIPSCGASFLKRAIEEGADNQSLLRYTADLQRELQSSS